MRRRTFVLALAATCLLGCSRDGAPVGGGLSDAERAVVDSYLSALERWDAGAITALALPGVDGRADASRRAAERGGRSIGEVRLAHTREFGPDLTRVEVTGRYADGSLYTEVVLLSREGGRWYLVLENAVSPSPRPASVSSPP